MERIKMERIEMVRREFSRREKERREFDNLYLTVLTEHVRRKQRRRPGLKSQVGGLLSRMRRVVHTVTTSLRGYLK